MTGQRRLTRVAPVKAPSPKRYLLAVVSAVAGLAIPLMAGPPPVLVVPFSTLVLVLSFMASAHRDPRKRVMVYPLVFAFSVPLLLNFGPVTWMIAALAGCAFLGATLGRTRRAAKQGPEVIPDPATEPMDVPGTTVASWAIGTDRFEELDPTGEKIDALLSQLGENFSILTLRRGSARLDAVGFTADAVEVYETDDVDSAAWHTLIASQPTTQVNHKITPQSPGQAEGESLRRAQLAARYFAVTGSRSLDVAWSHGSRPS